MKTMCPPVDHHNGVVATRTLRDVTCIMYTMCPSALVAAKPLW